MIYTVAEVVNIHAFTQQTEINRPYAFETK